MPSTYYRELPRRQPLPINSIAVSLFQLKLLLFPPPVFAGRLGAASGLSKLSKFSWEGSVACYRSCKKRKKRKKNNPVNPTAAGVELAKTLLGALFFPANSIFFPPPDYKNRSVLYERKYARYCSSKWHGNSGMYLAT